jgi:DNA polymerase
LPIAVKNALLDSNIKKSAWNCPFERGILKEKLGVWVPYDVWEDGQPSARYLSLPGKLDDVGDILALKPEFQKDKRGKDLIELFSKPHLTRKKKGEEQRQYFNDWTTHPKEWQEFGEYCKRDVIAARTRT